MYEYYNYFTVYYVKTKTNGPECFCSKNELQTINCNKQKNYNIDRNVDEFLTNFISKMKNVRLTDS